MLYPIKVIDIELSQPILTVEELEGYMGLQGLVRLHGVPLGYVKAPISLGRCTAATLSKLILEEHSEAIICQLLKNGLASPQRPADFKLEDLINLPPVEYEGEWPLVTVAVCTRDRPDDIKLCLEAITQLDYPSLDILVIDNAPATESTKDLIDQHYPQVRYVREPRPGLDWARNRAILEAAGDIIAYTDDDVMVDPTWAKRLAQVFAENLEVMAVTGLVVPYELEAEAQIVFEKNGGFGRGFERRWYKVHTGGKMPWDFVVRPGLFGTGANMAYRRELFHQIGGFDPALDVGTATNGGGDLEMFYRTLKEGKVLVYEPSAIVRHRHRQDYQILKQQITNNGSVYAYLICNAMRYPDEMRTLLKLGIKWLQIWHLKNFLDCILGVGKLPLDLVLAEAKGCWIGLFSYQTARANVTSISKEFGPLDQSIFIRPSTSVQNSKIEEHQATAVRTVELSEPIKPILDIISYAKVRIYVIWKGSPISCFEIDNQYADLSSYRICENLANHLKLKLLHLKQRHLSPEMQWSYSTAALYKLFNLNDRILSSSLQALPNSVKASIVVATYDRPEDLRNCIKNLQAQESARPIEIVIVDNHPASGLTPPVVAEFSNVVLKTEPRQGLAYARNAGIIASTGDIIVATDDDVTPSPDWLEKLLAPFSRPEVMAVTGNTLPIQLDTTAQQLFEQWGDGGLGRGFEKFEGTREWFERTAIHPVPAWKLGATANAAFRATIFSHPEIGLMYEPLGPGMPSGVGEDTYLLYKIMKADYTVVYEPSAYVWHRHRRDLPALRRQLYNYSKGIVSYQLTTLLNDKDQRALKMLFLDLPKWHIHRIKQRFQKQSLHPIPLSLLEIRGHLAGPWSLWFSHHRVRREGKSGTYLPVEDLAMSSTKNSFLEE